MWGRARTQLRRCAAVAHWHAIPTRYERRINPVGAENALLSRMLLPQVRWTSSKVKVRTKRYKTQRTPFKRLKPMVGGRRLMPAQSIYKRSVPKGFRRLTFQEIEHEKFKKVLTFAKLRQYAWSNSDEQSEAAAAGDDAPQPRRAATRWNDFEKVPTIIKRSKGTPPVKIKKRVRKIKVSTVVNFNGGEMRNLKPVKDKRKFLPRKRRPAQLPPSEKRIISEDAAAPGARKAVPRRVVFKGRPF